MRLGKLLAAVPLLFASLTFASDPIIIGHSTVQSGPLVSLATGPLQGIRALVDSVNARGGVSGRPLELLILDDGYEADRAAENVTSAVEQGAVAILMPIGTVPSLGAAQAANELGIPLIGPYTGAAPVRRHSPWAFMVRTGFQEEYDFIIRHLLTLNITDIAFAFNDNAGARGAMEGTARTLEASGHALSAALVIQNDASDAREQARAMASLNPAALLLSISNNVAAEFIPAFRQAGGQSQIYSFSFLNGRALQQDIGEYADNIIISQVVPHPWTVSMTLIRDYQDAMRSAGHQELSYDSLEGYLNARLLVDALNAAAPEITRESIRDALEAMNDHSVAGFPIRYSPDNHNGSSFIDLTMLRGDGRYIR